jgi:tetratricopeptide (TPR) repeat protein
MIRKFKDSKIHSPFSILHSQFFFLLPFVMVLSTVFVVRPELGNGVVSGKYFWFYLSMGVMAGVTIIQKFKDSRIQKFEDSMIQRFGDSGFKNVRTGWGDGLILLYGASTLLVGYFVHSSEATTKQILLLLVILLYFYFKALLRSSKPALYRLVLFFLVTGLVESYWGLRQLYGFDYSQHNRFKLTGSFFNPGPYACYIAVVLPCAFYYLLRHWDCTKVKFRMRYRPVYLRWGIALLTCVGALLVLPASMSRASWLAGLGGCGLVLYSKFKDSTIQKFKNTRFGKWMPVLGILVVVFGGIGMYRLKKDSADGRALIWKISLQTILHHPMGVGIGNFSGSYGQEQAAYFEAERGTEQEQYVAGNPEYGFNEYLQICIEQGILPFVLFLSLTGYGVYAGIRRKRIAATASLLALLIAATMSYPFSVLPFLIVMAFLLAWIFQNSMIQKFNDSMIQKKRNSRIGERCMAICSLLLVAGCLYNRYPTYQAYKQWGRSKILHQSGAHENAVGEYAHLYPQLSDRLDFLFEYAQSLSKTGRYAESNRVLQQAVRISCDPMLYNVMGKNEQALKHYAEAERCFRKAAHIVPNRIYPWYLLANLYVETGETEKARATAKIVLTKEPKVQSTAVREMREKMKIIMNYEL